LVDSQNLLSKICKYFTFFKSCGIFIDEINASSNKVVFICIEEEVPKAAKEATTMPCSCDVGVGSGFPEFVMKTTLSSYSPFALKPG
jgi:hypothetical protein